MHTLTIAKHSIPRIWPEKLMQLKEALRRHSHHVYLCVAGDGEPVPPQPNVIENNTLLSLLRLTHWYCCKNANPWNNMPRFRTLSELSMSSTGA
ncbi:hypothetical protein L2E82_11532 [Cichorium intybus]|uniref:Uncharacterized protein n=1 Tax=Cichorium intybus TaxID=13427 RepID=A0ACB9GDL4_CICIN|nr:hypothetical protein L2E82_11532 [Cichorium intybus]